MVAAQVFQKSLFPPQPGSVDPHITQPGSVRIYKLGIWLKLFLKFKCKNNLIYRIFMDRTERIGFSTVDESRTQLFCYYTTWFTLQTNYFMFEKTKLFQIFVL